MVALCNREITDAQILGSVGFTGISTKTWELILPEIDYDKLHEMFNMLDPSKIYYKRTVEFLSSIKGIGPATADTIAREFTYFQKDADWIFQHGKVVKFVPRTGKKIRFTGFRDKAFCEYLNSIGFLADDDADVTRDTYVLLVPDASYQSKKTQKAKRQNIMIVPINEFRENIESYK